MTHDPLSPAAIEELEALVAAIPKPLYLSDGVFAAYSLRWLPADSGNVEAVVDILPDRERGCAIGHGLAAAVNAAPALLAEIKRLRKVEEAAAALPDLYADYINATRAAQDDADSALDAGINALGSALRAAIGEGSK